jgi:hypothetical protein
MAGITMSPQLRESPETAKCQGALGSAFEILSCASAETVRQQIKSSPTDNG